MNNKRDGSPDTIWLYPALCKRKTTGEYFILEGPLMRFNTDEYARKILATVLPEAGQEFVRLINVPEMNTTQTELEEHIKTAGIGPITSHAPSICGTGRAY